MLGISQASCVTLVLALAISSTAAYQSNDFYQPDQYAHAVERSFEKTRGVGNGADLLESLSNLGSRSYQYPNAAERSFEKTRGVGNGADLLESRSNLGSRSYQYPNAAERSFEKTRGVGNGADLLESLSNLGSRSYEAGTPYDAKDAFQSLFNRRDDGAVSCDDCCKKNSELANRVKDQSKTIVDKINKLTEDYRAAAGNLARTYVNDLKNLQNQLDAIKNDPNRNNDASRLLNNIGNSVTNNGWGQERRRSIEKRQALNVGSQPKCCHDNRCFLNCRCESQENMNNGNNVNGNNNNDNNGINSNTNSNTNGNVNNGNNNQG